MPISPLLNQNTNRNSSSIKTVFWRSPGVPWLEINTDGLATGNLRISVCGFLRSCFTVALGLVMQRYMPFKLLILLFPWDGNLFG